MKVLLEIKDHKAGFVMELLKSLPFVKAKAISGEKAKQITELTEAVEGLNQVLAGKAKAKPARQMLDEL